MGLLTELQKRVSDRWLYRLLLPATLFTVAAVVGGGQLGQRHWNDVGRARANIAKALRIGSGVTAGTVALLIVLAVAAAAVALAIHLATGAVTVLVVGEWPRSLSRINSVLTAKRVRRWEKAAKEWARSSNPPTAGGSAQPASRRYLRIALYKPTCPTWSGDRLAAAEKRAAAGTGIDIATSWTALLLVVPESIRTALRSTSSDFDGACEAMSWGIASMVLGLWWWPSAVAGLALSFAAWRWIRITVTALCETIEAVVSMHVGTLAQQLMLPAILPDTDDEGRRRIGALINSRLQMRG